MHCKQARQQIDRLPQTAQASPELTQHIAQCSPCAKFFEERTALRNALDNLRAKTASLGPSTHVEQQVLAALDAPGFQPLRTHHPLRWITVSALALAALLLASVVFPVSPTQPVSPIAEVQHEQPFTALPYVVPAAPDERTTVVRTRVSSQIMQDAGLHVQDDPGSTALADVVLSQDGRLLALRLVSHPDPTSEKRIN
jgi:hypothetical protein